MIDLSPAQAASRITALLAVHESRTLDFKRIGAKHGKTIETICAFAGTPLFLMSMICTTRMFPTKTQQ